MHPELDAYLRQLDAIRADARQLVAGLSDAEFNRRPAAGRWSAAECLDHLNMVRKVLPAIDRAITNAAARGLRGDGPFRYGWFARWMIRSFEPPPRRRFRNPRLLEPAHQPLAPDAVLQEFLSLRDALTRRVRQADGLDLQRAIVVSPVSRFFRMPLGGYFAFLLAHDRRHLWQARQALGAGAAPR